MSRQALPLALILPFTLTACGCGIGSGGDGAASGEGSGGALGRVFEPASRALEQLNSEEEGGGKGSEQFWDLLPSEDFNDLLDDVMEELGVSPESSARATILRNRREVETLTARVQSIREELAAAPPEGEVGILEGLYTDSKEDLREELEGVRARIDELRSEDAGLERRVRSELRELGLELSREDVSTLLTTVTGEEFTELVVATNTVREVAVQLEALASEPDAPADSAPRYYGVYLVMLHAMERMHEQFIERIEWDLLPRLDEITAEAESLIERTERRVDAGGDLTIAELNRSSNELTIRAAELYSLYLSQQAASMEERVGALRSNIEDAKLTYETISLSGQVAQLIRSGVGDLDSLLQLQPPPMARLESPELREEFSRLSRRMVSP